MIAVRADLRELVGIEEIPIVIGRAGQKVDYLRVKK
jgi:hypothetical protein